MWEIIEKCKEAVSSEVKKSEVKWKVQRVQQVECNKWSKVKESEVKWMKQSSVKEAKWKVQNRGLGGGSPYGEGL